MTSKEIRKSFIDFFKKKDHSYVSSSPVVPSDDPTLLFTNAGMNQFKDILLGKGTRPFSRAVNTQKCIRVSGKHNDLEEVGHDTYHHTFFEMLGNWSFGDYYKKEAIKWAWELLTDVWNLPKEKLYATVFREDDEAAGLWIAQTDIDADRVLRYDEKDNFWEMGETGPCGPCSEIHIDLGPERCDRKDIVHTCRVNGDCGRFIELWNLVFIQYNRDDRGKLHSLPAKHVDTGAGFERLVAVLQNKKSNYDTDVFTPLLEQIGRLTGMDYNLPEHSAAFNVIADHIRMLVFSITDGGFPSNEGRGYVIRRILRRAARYGRNLNKREPFLYQLVDVVVSQFGDVFPELKERAAHVSTVIHAEEEHFNRTLDRGLEIFEKIKKDLVADKSTIISGSDVFRLYDTYGFPVDLTRILAEENNLTIDEAGFDTAMKEQQNRARQKTRFKDASISDGAWTVLNEETSSNFVGFTDDAIETHITKYAVMDDHVHVVLKETPFYAESGGQIGDQGRLIAENLELEVTDTQKDGNDIVHICRLPQDFNITSDRVLAEIETSGRRQTEKNHTATHLLHASLRRVLGTHVQQAGSLVEPGRLRFDFTHHSKLSSDEILEIEKLVNDKVQEDIALQIGEDSFENAKKRGAMALFDEKYEDIVRTIQIDSYSLELCGGTHVHHTGQIGPFIIIYEGSIAAGVRRIEALTGREAVRYLQNARSQVQQISELLNAREDELASKTKELLDKKRQAEKEAEKLSTRILSSGIESILEGAETVNGIQVISRIIADSNVEQLKDMGDKILEQAKNTVALLGTNSGGKLGFVCLVTDELISGKKLNAGKLVREIAAIAGGSGGGRPHMATAGAKDLAKFEEAMHAIYELVKKQPEIKN